MENPLNVNSGDNNVGPVRRSGSSPHSVSCLWCVMLVSELADWSSGGSSLEPCGMTLVVVGSFLLFLIVFQNASLAFSVVT